MHSRIYLTAAIVAAFCTGSVFAAKAPRPQPQSFSGSYRSADSIQTQSYAALDMTQVGIEDAAREVAGRPHRFAIPHEAAIDARTSGTWEQNGDRSIWRYRVKADMAASLNFGFTTYHLPPSAQLFIYDADHRQVAGPYDAKHNGPHGQLWTPVIASSDVIVELDLATNQRSDLKLILGSINQGYRGLGTGTKGYVQPDLGQPKLGKALCSPDQISSGTCNMDVACLAEDDPWNNPRRAVGAITLGGSDDCSGSLVNNTSNDRRMLFITASHCELDAASSPTVVVYWNYEWPTCRTPGTSASGQSNPPDPNMSNSGATFLAQTQSPFGGCTSNDQTRCSDNTLVELDDPANPDFNLFWEGWDRRMTSAVCSQSTTDPTSTAGLCASIHQPQVEEKRITFVKQNLDSVGYAGGIVPVNQPVSHWHAHWDPTPPILAGIVSPPATLPPGVTEPGSSGSPLFSSEQRLVGVLSGGPSQCGATGENLSDFYGQLAQAWEGDGTATTRLKDYLDPVGTAPDFIDGIGMSPFTLDLTPASLAVCASVGSATVNIAVGADPGFTDPVDLGATGAPAGATTSFVPSSVTPPNNSVLTIGSLASATAGSYAIAITGTSGADSTSKTLAFSLNDVAPTAVTLSSPIDNATSVATAPTLTWTASTAGGPQDYLVEVATDASFTSIVFTQTVHDATTVTVAPALASSTNYYWRVTASNGCGTAAASMVFHFKTITAPGDCDVGTTPTSIFTDDVEGGVNGWTTTGSTGVSTWAISATRANSPTHAWHAVDIATVSDQRLISPTIALPANENPLTLQFQTWREIEQSSTLTTCFDGAILEVSTDGTTFTQVPDASIISGGNYVGTVSSGFSSPLAGLKAWCNTTVRPFTDGPVRVDVSGYAGQSVQFRFRLGTDSSAAKEGWYVDDIGVSACQAGNDVIFADGFEDLTP